MATENSGGRVNYYLVEVKHPQREDQPPYRAECEDIIEALDLNFDEANMFKEIWRGARARQGAEKEGNTALRGAQKLVHYAGRILRRVERSTKTKEATPIPKMEWIEWKGEFDMPPGLTSRSSVEVMTEKNGILVGYAGGFEWKHKKYIKNIVRYRIL